MIRMIRAVSPKLNTVQWAEAMLQIVAKVLDGWLLAANASGEQTAMDQAKQVYDQLCEALSTFIGQLTGALEMGQELQVMS